MSNNKTTATEISLALGLGGYNLTLEDILKIKNTDESEAFKVLDFMKESKNAKLCEQFRRVGLKIREHNKKAYSGETIIEWVGNSKISTGISSARDLLEHYGPVSLSYSVKNDSDIIYNSSPARLEQVTTGKYIHGSKHDNWYQTVASEAYQELFEICDGLNFTGFKTVLDWDSSKKTKEEKKAFSKFVANKIKTNNSIKEAYKSFCNTVSENTAKLYDTNLNLILKNNSNELKSIFWNFFRIDSNPYILCGTEKKKDFAVKVMDINAWDREYKIKSVNAIQKIAGQPEVLINFTFVDLNNKVYNFSLKVELRWSHGKFCGNPEAKVYKNFSYKDLPWNTVII